MLYKGDVQCITYLSKLPSAAVGVVAVVVRIRALLPAFSPAFRGRRSNQDTRLAYRTHIEAGRARARDTSERLASVIEMITCQRDISCDLESSEQGEYPVHGLEGLGMDSHPFAHTGRGCMTAHEWGCTALHGRPWTWEELPRRTALTGAQREFALEQRNLFL